MLEPANLVIVIWVFFWAILSIIVGSPLRSCWPLHSCSPLYSCWSLPCTDIWPQSGTKLLVQVSSSKWFDSIIECLLECLMHIKALQPFRYCLYQFRNLQMPFTSCISYDVAASSFRLNIICMLEQFRFAKGVDSYETELDIGPAS